VPGLNAEFLSRDALEALGFKSLGDDVLIHRTAVIVNCQSISLASRIRIDPYVVISTSGNVEFGNNIHIGCHSSLAGHGDIQLEDFANISHGVHVFTTRDDHTGRVLTNPTVSDRFTGVRTAAIRFGRHSAIGAGSVLLPGAGLSEGTIIGALSLVSRRLKPWTIYAGIPARRVRERQRHLLALEKEYGASLQTLADDRHVR
jgi:galactoside O-acetyltransferase